MRTGLKLTSLFLGTLFALSSLVGCSCSGSGKTLPADEERVQLEKYDGTHIYTAPDTSNYLVQSGSCQYKIVIPENASETIVRAKDEFVSLFETATDIRLSAIEDTNLTHSATNRYISIGETTLFESSGLTVDKDELGTDGCRIQTKDKTVFICGGSDYGSLFSVYTFMQITFDYETYFRDCMEIETNVKNKKLKAYDVTDIPDFEFRGWYQWEKSITWDLEDYDDSMFVWRMRYRQTRHGEKLWIWSEDSNALGVTPFSTLWISMGRYNNHLTNPDTYHPKWFSTEGKELCYTARGDEEEYQALLDKFVSSIMIAMSKQTPEQYPERNIIPVYQNDNSQYCRCEKCKELYDKYGNMSGIYISFMSDLARAVKEELKKEEHAAYARDNLQFECYAYAYSDVAPARYDAEKGEWVSLVENLDEDVYVYYAPSYEYQTSYTDPVNDVYRKNLDAWEAVLGKGHWRYYLYDTNYANYGYMLDTFDYYTAETFSHFAAKSNLMIYFDSPYSKTTMTAWQNLKQYLKAKLIWDTSLDAGELIDNYFNAMYKDAASIMKSLFMSERAYWQEVLIDVYGLSGGVRPKLDGLEFWPIAMMEEWIGRTDAAKQAVARYQSIDPELYDEICQHIEAEAIGLIYTLLENQRSYLSDTTRQKYIDRLYYDMEWMNAGSVKVSTGTLQAWLAGLK